ncbi:tryptophan 7-halogenase [Blastopirellula sp. J2-11]|uniref:NAD(P)/FAD-dependent oxidoreductase n=1 Tax=Blastopirellula sp. J2-11 TaxID=2943192 RepID=UPI0021C5DB11|nr:NAD(P)/FAD-dependent oxidoreductase [Blastopirellula sp. J2-11]UUO07244.1 tryptophan 7-halogenase [Blastopirellula sp. J2-11]
MIASDKPNVVVIGGGPAGSTVSTLIAQKGYRVELFEREVFPRYHIGESMIPETYWVLKRLNMLDKMKGSHFIKKYSVQFVGQSGRLSAPFYFHDNKPHECSQTWQVRRSEFDLMMIENAAEHGVTVHQGTRVLEVLFDGDRAIGVKVADPSGETREVFADVVVDASGQSSMLINKFKLRVPDPELNKGAIWTYFKGAYRDVGKDEGATVVLSVQGKNGWFWYIPLHDDIVSVGVVGDFDYLFKGRTSHEQTYAEELERCPAVKERVENAEQVEKIFATKDYTYRASQGSGDGWVLVGDAFGFLDPLYSSGVLLALKSGELAADAICDGLEKGDTSKDQLGHWVPNYLVGMKRMRRLVSEYYEGFNFGRFIRRFPHYTGRVTDLLIGDLFKDDLDEVIASMDQMKAEDEEARLMSTKEQD